MGHAHGHGIQRPFASALPSASVSGTHWRRGTLSRRFTGHIDFREDDGVDLEPDNEGETVMWDSDPHRSQKALA